MSGLLLEQIYLGCLSQASYLVGDRQSGRAVVVDPRRDIDEYLQLSARYGLRIELIVLTHVHADFVPGHSELAEATGAEVAMGAAAPVDFPIRRLVDGERIALGDDPDSVALEVLSTPGHTPESITLAVFEHARDAVPHALLTGDTLFLGDVGRPDLLGSAGRSAEEMARQLYRSLHEKILPFPDEVLVYPGHGAGSACGKALSTDTVSTLGQQRLTNYALAADGEDTFVAAVTLGLAEPPAYFREEVALNRAGHATFDPAAMVPEVDPATAVAKAGREVLLLDVRDDQSFAAGHLRGAVNVGLSGRFAEYAAAVRMPGQPVMLFGSGEEVAEARVRLARVGIDAVTGVVTRLETLTERPELVAPSSRVDHLRARQVVQANPRLQILDVRGLGEALAAGEVPGALNIPLPQLLGALDRLDRDRPLLVYCAGGYRSIAAASLLESLGFRDVSDLLGGFGAWQTAQPATA